MNERLMLWGLQQLRRAAWVVPFLPLVARAQLQVDDPQVPFTNLGQLIEGGFNIVIVVAGVAFVVLFLIGGVMYLTGAGNEDTVKKARQLLLDAVIGLVIVVIAWAVGNYVLDLLNITISTDEDRGGAGEQTPGVQGGQGVSL
ncbi:hypothetical protein HY374_03330 [Candidatus Berkelbacteria bacterium]|nr:hypothetical protein [Candidatus Berkelbacteria bacterium]